MWHLKPLTAETLKWYKDTYLDAVKQSVKNSNIKQSVKDLLLPADGTDVIGRLLLWPPDRLYALNADLEPQNRRFSRLLTTMAVYQGIKSPHMNWLKELERGHVCIAIEYMHSQLRQMTEHL